MPRVGASRSAEQAPHGADVPGVEGSTRRDHRSGVARKLLPFSASYGDRIGYAADHPCQFAEAREAIDEASFRVRSSIALVMNRLPGMGPQPLTLDGVTH